MKESGRAVLETPPTVALSDWTAKMQAKSTPTLSPSQTDLAWAAGFFDGEGSVSFGKAGKPGHRYLLVSVSNNDTRGLESLHAWFGGRFYFELSRRCSRWTIRSRHAEAFLKSIRPYVRLKGDVIDVALRFQETIGPRGTRCVTADVWDMRERLHAELLSINRRT
jgi:hypothetical protein